MASRRDLLLALSAAAWSAGNAQPASRAPKRIGLISAIVPGEVEPWKPVLLEDMRAKGWHPGVDLLIEHAQDVDFRSDLPALVEALIKKRIDLLAIYGHDAAVLAAARTTKTLPIVFCLGGSPVERGFVDSLAAPGRNLTGTTASYGVEIVSKRLEFLRAMAPEARRLAWLSGPLQLEKVEGGVFDLERVLDKAATSLGFESRFFRIREAADVRPALLSATAWGAQAISAGGGYAYTELASVIAYALQARLPTASARQGYVEAGGLMSYGVGEGEWPALAHRWATQIDRVLRGAPPSSLPVELPRRFELWVNAKTAKALGVVIPRSVLARADNIIE